MAQRQDTLHSIELKAASHMTGIAHTSQGHLLAEWMIQSADVQDVRHQAAKVMPLHGHIAGSFSSLNPR